MSQTDNRTSRIEAAKAFLNLLVRGAPKTGVLMLTARMRREEGERDHFVSTAFTAEEVPAAAKWAINFCDNKETDVYVRCSLLREKPQKGRGKKEDTLGASVLWVDLDGDQKEILTRLKSYPRPPSHIHSSGHGIHAFWLLERFSAEAQEIEGRNRGIARDLGSDLADRGWDITRVLRIPGTFNYKESEALPVETLESTGEVHPILVFPFLAAPERTTSMESLTLEKLPDNFLDKLPEKLRNLIETGKGGQKKANGKPDRSANDWATVRALLDLNHSPNICLSVLCHPQWASGEKVREARSVDYALMTIARATEGRVEYQLLEKARGELQAWTGLEFMAMEFPPIQWQVENIWLDNNIGFLAGEPKTFKTWLALDMMLSIASGTPFLNRYPVHRSGPVLLVQREDPPGYLQDRIKKIAIAKGFGGTMSAETDGRKITLHLPPPIPPFYVWTDPSFQLSDEKSIARLNEWLELQGCKSLAAIIFDPLLKLAFGFDEFKAGEVMTHIFQPTDALRSRWGASIIIVHHESKNSERSRGGQRMYGSVGLHAFTESALYLRRVGATDVDITPEYKSAQATPFSVRFANLDKEYKPELKAIQLTVLPLMEYLSSLDHSASLTEVQEHFQLQESEINKVLNRAIQKGAIVVVPGARRKGEPNRFKVAEEEGESEK